MYDLKNKLVDCSELVEMVGGEQVFDMIKVMCGGKSDQLIYCSLFSSLKVSPFLSVTNNNIYFLGVLTGLTGFSVIKPVDIVGEARMNAAKDGATLVMPGARLPNVNVSETVFYWSNGYVQHPDKPIASPMKSGLSKSVVAYRLFNSETPLVPPAPPLGTQRITIDGIKTLFMKQLHTSEIQYYDSNVSDWLFPSDKNKALKQWNQASIYNPGPSIKSKILAKKVNLSAQDIIKAGLGHISDRAVTYDKPEGERSMSATVEAFNSVTGHNLTEEQGWHFMTLLKIVRSQQGNFKVDNYEDGSAYFGLAGEAANKTRGTK